MNENFCKSLVDAVSTKRVVIYGAGNAGAVMLNILEERKIKVLFFLDRDHDKQINGFFGYEVKPPEDILYEDMSEIIIVIAVGIKNEVEEYLSGLGLKKDVEFIHGLTLQYEPCNEIDPFLGYTRTDDISGFKIMGEYNEGYDTIICLGGSTTDYSYHGIKSWPKYLSEIITKDCIKANVLNGGMAGYNSSQELLRLLRDGVSFDPSLVISYSGVNDLGFEPIWGHKYLNEIWDKMWAGGGMDSASKVVWSTDIPALSHGIKPKLDSAEYWYRNEKIMCHVCRGLSIRFLGILQPCLYTRKTKSYSLYESRVLQTDGSYVDREYVIEQYNKVKRMIREEGEEDIIDCTDIFDAYEDIYVDMYHVFERGNQLVAEAVYRKIRERMMLNC